MVGCEGQQLGHYRLNSLIGQGGFAEVYRAEHIHLGTLAAIKLLRMQLGNEEGESFLKEARNMAHLIHPNIIRILDYGVDHLMPYLVMDFAPNGTLRQRHPRGSLVPLNIVVSYVKQIAQALFYAHEQHIIHCDVKPQNMLIGRGNEILLSDFGIAVVTGSNTISQPTQGIAGTPIYMAPEQFEGRQSRASDQYALGIVVYEWLCGNPPFQTPGSSIDTTVRRQTAPASSLTYNNSNIVPIIENVVLKTLEYNADHRFASVLEFANNLERAVSEVDKTIIRFFQNSSWVDKSKPLDQADSLLSGQEKFVPPTFKAIDVRSPYGDKPYSSLIPEPSHIHKIQIDEFPDASPWAGKVIEEDISAANQFLKAGFLPNSTALFPDSELPTYELKDAFIIYSKMDRRWAEWIAWQLNHAGYSIILPVWSVLPDTDMELELSKSYAKARRTIIVLSPYLLKAISTKPDWMKPFRGDAINQQHQLLPIYVHDSRGKYKKLIESIHYIDLSMADEEKARMILLEVMNGEYLAPLDPPVFPGNILRDSSGKNPATTGTKARPVIGGEALEQVTQVTQEPMSSSTNSERASIEEGKPASTVEIFFSYSHRDKRLRSELEKYLSHLKRLPLVKAWHDGEIGAGKEWAQEINRHLSDASIILLLVSQDFIASDYCYNIEMQRAIARHEAGEARVIPILLKTAIWEKTPIGKLQVLPSDARPITLWPDRGQAFMDVAIGIQKEIEKLTGRL